MKVTMQKIADAAGVSKMTVSRILNGKAAGQVSDAVRDHVRQVAESYGYDPGRKFRAIPLQPLQDRCRRLIYLITRSSLLDPGGIIYLKNSYEMLLRLAKQQDLEIDLQQFYQKSGNIFDWKGINGIQSGSSILTLELSGLPALIGLQRRGCRVGVIQRDLYWREYYAPQLKNMYCFILKSADAISRSTRLLLDSGCRKVACVFSEEYMHEPNYPIRLGYNYALSLANSQYNRPIILTSRNLHWKQDFQKAYKENPFDGLVFNENEFGNDTGIGNLHEFLGLPEEVKLITRTPENGSPFSDVFAMYGYPMEKVLKDALKILTEPKFSPGEKFYNCEFIDPRSGRHLC